MFQYLTKLINLRFNVLSEVIMKLILKLFFIYLCFCFSVASAEVRINNITFDSSDSVIILSASGSDTAPVIKKGVLQNPDRIFLDIDNAVLTRKQGNFDFKYGRLQNFRISQFSVSPSVVRVVMTYNSKFNPSDLKVYYIGGSIIIKIADYKHTQDYLTPIYREVKASAYDYFEKLRITETEIIPPEPVPSAKSENEILSQIDKTILTPKTDLIEPKTEPLRVNPPLIESKLLSRFYVQDINVRQGSLLLAGMGVVNLEKVIYLSNPDRVVFDIPNAICAKELRNREFRLNDTDTVKVGQFEPTKIRIVITTPNPQKYTAVYSNDLQNILISSDDIIPNLKLYSKKSNLLSAKVSVTKEYRYNTDKIQLEFSDPIVHSLKRNKKSLELRLYNASAYSIASLTKKLKTGSIKNILADKYGAEGILITIPISQETTVDCLENMSATKLVLSVKNPVTVTPSKNNLSGKFIIIDPGHGGSDPGATRNNIQEKQLTIDISKKIAKKLEEQGAKVYMTRYDDTFVSLSDRVDVTNNKKPDLFVSVHINACENEEINGIETHYWKDDSLDFAKAVHKSVMSKIDGNNRGVIKSRFYVIRHTTIPAILLELGFISNPDERNELLSEERQEKSAEAVCEGIINYFGKGG